MGCDTLAVVAVGTSTIGTCCLMRTILFGFLFTSLNVKVCLSAGSVHVEALTIIELEGRGDTNGILQTTNTNNVKTSSSTRYNVIGSRHTTSRRPRRVLHTERNHRERTEHNQMHLHRKMQVSETTTTAATTEGGPSSQTNSTTTGTTENNNQIVDEIDVTASMKQCMTFVEEGKEKEDQINANFDICKECTSEVDSTSILQCEQDNCQYCNTDQTTCIQYYYNYLFDARINVVSDEYVTSSDVFEYITTTSTSTTSSSSETTTALWYDRSIIKIIYSTFDTIQLVINDNICSSIEEMDCGDGTFDYKIDCTNLKIPIVTTTTTESESSSNTTTAPMFLDSDDIVYECGVGHEVFQFLYNPEFFTCVEVNAMPSDMPSLSPTVLYNNPTTSTTTSTPDDGPSSPTIPSSSTTIGNRRHQSSTRWLILPAVIGILCPLVIIMS